MRPFLRQVILRNYKSIASCKVDLPDLCFLVGKNGAGKSNFVDALRLVSDALNSTLDHALRDRSGIKEVRRKSAGHPNHFSIRLDFDSNTGETGSYAFEIAAQKQGGFLVKKEECKIYSESVAADELNDLEPAFYRVESGSVVGSSMHNPPPAKGDRLYLVHASGFDEFRGLFESLSRMGFYNLNPDAIRMEQPPDVGLVLKRDGSNLASVLQRMEKSAPEAKTIVEQFLSKVVPGIESVNTRSFLSKETLEFRQKTRGAKNPWNFLAANMSDGTLRSLGILIALFQGRAIKEHPTPLVCIEEPESALHPSAAGALRDALRVATQDTQVLVTSHSPDLLDDKDISADSIIYVSNTEGVTSLTPLDETSRSVIRDRLCTPGELLRMDQLGPDENRIDEQDSVQLDIFSQDVI